jgi:catechol 2,3-dioxygenase-like lactoylglutathione lyase family enzyme
LATVSIRHVGICVADIERSSRFYTGALGFEALMKVTEIGAPFDTLIEQPGATLRVQQLRCGDVTIELLGFSGTEVTGSAERQPMNRRGFTHMTLVVDDIESTAQRIREYGGSIHPETRIESPFGPLLFCTDPDGVRIELMQKPA